MSTTEPPRFPGASFGIAPRIKLWSGCAIAASGAVAQRWCLDLPWPAGIGIGAVVVGCVVLAIGACELRRQRAFELEVATALDMRDELARDLAELVATGGNPSRFLAAKGFRSYAVRRWIAAGFGPGDGA